MAKQFSLTGIIRRSSGCLALINGRLLAAGQSLGDAQVVEVKEDQVILKLKDGVFRLQLPTPSL
jgi:hypothetical protein